MNVNQLICNKTLQFNYNFCDNYLSQDPTLLIIDLQ